MIPVQISTKLEGKVYTATLRCVLKGEEHVVQTKGSGEPKDSRQRLELLAVLAGLSRMVKPSEITIKGSGYIKTGFQYLNTWQKADWKKSNGKSSSQCRSVAEGGRGCQNT